MLPVTSNIENQTNEEIILFIYCGVPYDRLP